MTAQISRREWPLLVVAFLLGLLVSGAAAAGYVLLMTTGGGQSSVVTSDTLQVREREGGNGEIALAQRRIAQRLEAARVPTLRIRGGISLRVGNVVWTDAPRRPFLRANRLNGTISVAAAEHGDIIVDNVTVAGADVLLDQREVGGEWNYERVLAEFLTREKSADVEPTRTIMLRNVTIADSRAEVRQPNRSVDLEDVDGGLSRIQISGPSVPDPVLDVRHIDAVYEDLDRKQNLDITADNAHLVLPEGRVDFTAASATVASAKLSELSGRWQPSIGGLGLIISGRARDVAFAELAFLSERVPKEGGGSFRFAFRSLGGDDMEVHLSEADIRAEGSHVRGAVAGRTAGETFELISVDATLDPLALDLVKRMSGRELPYGGTVSGTVRGTEGAINFDVKTNLTAEGVIKPIVTDVTGVASFRKGVFALQRLNATLNALPAEALRPLMPNLPFRGAITGTVALSGPAERSPLNLDVRLDIARGVAQVNGVLDLTGTEPAYDLNGRLIGISLQELLEPKAPPALLTARFSLKGHGSDPKTAEASVGVVGRFTEWRALPHDTVVIAAQVRNGAVAIDTGIVFLGPVHLETAGQWRFVAPESGALNYHLLVEDLAAVAAFLPAMPDSAAGRLDGRGSVAGSLDRMRIDGSLTGRNVKVMRWTAASLEGKYQAVLGEAVPQIDVQGTARDIATPADGTYSSATVNLKLTPPEFALDVKADRPQGGGLDIAANGSVPYEGARHVLLTRARVDAAQGQWALAGPASIDWGGGGGLRLTNFEMRNTTASGLVRINGRLFPLADVDARIETNALPIDVVQRLLGRDPLVKGLLTTTTNVHGPGATPTFDVQFRLDSGEFRGIPFSRVDGKVNYAGQKLTGNALATFDTAGTAELRAALPMQVAFAPKMTFDLLDDGAVEGSLVADSVALAPFALMFPELRDVQGAVRANAQFTGTVSNPSLTGTIAVVNGALTPVMLDRRYTDINAEIVFNQRSAEIRKLHAFSGGPLDATGRIDFPELGNPQADVTVTLNKFRPAGVDAHTDAAASGEVKITGPLLSPVISGMISLSDGDIPLPAGSGVTMNTDITDLREPISIGSAGSSTPFFSRVTLDNFRVRVERGTWFDMETSRAELAGELTINKQGDDMRVLGTLEGQRGTYVLEAGPILRRFEVTHAQVRFLGDTELNPSLDITARRVIFDASGRQMDIEVRVGGTMRAPTLSLASADAAAIPQSELLSFLLFGQQNIGLGNTSLPGEALIQETFVGGIAELATLEIENAIGAPFDLFQLRLGGSNGLGGLQQSSLVVGRELSRDVFLTVESGIAAIFGEQESSSSQTFAIRLEWRVNRWTTARIGYEPADRTRIFRGLDVLQVTRPPQQGSLEIRRRWQW